MRSGSQQCNRKMLKVRYGHTCSAEVVAFEKRRPARDFSNTVSSPLGFVSTRISDWFWSFLVLYPNPPNPKQNFEIVRDSKGLEIREQPPIEAVAQNQ